MRTQLLFVICFLALISCNSVKNTQEAINTGDFEEAISLIVYRLQKNKTAKYNQSYIPLLEQGFKKLVVRDLKRVDFLEKEQNKENLEKIYTIYTNLTKVQNKIEALLPLLIVEENRDASFKFNNYTNEILNTKNQLSTYLYSKVNKLFLLDTKLDYRRAYKDLEYLEKIHPNYRDVRSLIQVAHEKGTDFVLVSIKNETQKIIPKKLEEELLDFDAYGLNSLWTVYHVTKIPVINYSFGLQLNLKVIDVSPESVKEKEIFYEKNIKKGFEDLLDDDGNPVFDKDGNKVKVDKFVPIRCRLNIFDQFKLARVVGQVKYLDLNTTSVLESFPIESEFAFKHVYANFKGDKRALDKEDLDLVRERAVPFPTNEQMIYDIGQDLKHRFKTIITQNKLND